MPVEISRANQDKLTPKTIHAAIHEGIERAFNFHMASTSRRAGWWLGDAPEYLLTVHIARAIFKKYRRYGDDYFIDLECQFEDDTNKYDLMIWKGENPTSVIEVKKQGGGKNKWMNLGHADLRNDVGRIETLLCQQPSIRHGAIGIWMACDSDEKHNRSAIKVLLEQIEKMKDGLQKRSNDQINWQVERKTHKKDKSAWASVVAFARR